MAALLVGPNMPDILELYLASMLVIAILGMLALELIDADYDRPTD
jgi:hypothetical protein